MRNWKTSLAGIGTILTLVAKLATGTADYATDIPLLIAAVGLLVSKDYNVSGTGAGVLK
jgi:hypothetical protein